VANPLALMLAAAQMLDHVGMVERGEALRRAIRQAVVEDGVRTRDLGGNATTAELTAGLKRRL